MENIHAKLFVGGISQETNENTLREHFSEYGKVKEAQIIKDRITNKGRGFGFITFADLSVAHNVLQLKHIILGRLVEVNIARPKVDRYQNQDYQEQQINRSNRNNNNGNSDIQLCAKKIFVGGLPSSLEDEEFKEYFRRFGVITDAVVIYDKETKKSRGFGFVTFDSEEAVLSVLQNQFHELSDSFVEVKRAKPKNVSEDHNAGLNIPYFQYYNDYLGCVIPYGSVPWHHHGAGFSHAPNGVVYQPFTGSALSTYYHNPNSYGNYYVYPTYINGAGYNNGQDSQQVAMTNGGVRYQSSIFILHDNTSVGDDTGGDAEDPVHMILPRTDDALHTESSDAAVTNGGVSYQNSTSILHNNISSVDDTNGDAEVPVCLILPQTDDTFCAESSDAEHQKEADCQCTLVRDSGSDACLLQEKQI